MKKLFISSAIVLVGCGAGGGEAGKTLGLLGLSAPLGSKAAMGGAEHTNADQIPDHVLDRAFTYALVLMDKQDEAMHLISTLVPHAEGYTYALVNEKVVSDSIWQMTFKAEEDEHVERGLYLHTDHQVPVVFDGKKITEVEVVVLDVNGNATGEIGGVPGQPKTKKPKRVRWMHGQELDPALPQPENVTVYLNGGKVEGESYLVGYAWMHTAAKELSLKNDLVHVRVEFSANPDSAGHEFLFFDHKATDFGDALITTRFMDGDGDPLNTPRETRERP